MSNKWQSEKD